MAAGNGEAWTGGDHARAGDVSGVDVLAEIDGEEGGRAYVANGGESGFEGLACVDDSGDGGVVRSLGEGEDFVVAVGAAGEVGVAVDEAGEDVACGEVEDLGSGGRSEAGRFDGSDALVGDDEGGVVDGEWPEAEVEEMAGADVGGWRGLLGWSGTSPQGLRSRR